MKVILGGGSITIATIAVLVIILILVNMNTLIKADVDARVFEYYINSEIKMKKGIFLESRRRRVEHFYDYYIIIITRRDKLCDRGVSQEVGGFKKVVSSRSPFHGLLGRGGGYTIIPLVFLCECWFGGGGGWKGVKTYETKHLGQGIYMDGDNHLQLRRRRPIVPFAPPPPPALGKFVVGVNGIDRLPSRNNLAYISCRRFATI